MEVAASYPDNLDKIKMMTTTAKKKKDLQCRRNTFYIGRKCHLRLSKIENSMPGFEMSDIS